MKKKKAETQRAIKKQNSLFSPSHWLLLLLQQQQLGHIPARPL